MRILGLDPGSLQAGYAMIEIQKSNYEVLEMDVIKLKGEFSFRLGNLGEQVGRVIEKWSPQLMSIEKIFLGKNPHSSFQLGHARGVCMYEAARNKVQVVEYATREVKKGVTGNGNATKEEVQLWLRRLLKFSWDASAPQNFDVTDALALAYHHARILETEGRLRQLQEVLR